MRISRSRIYQTTPNLEFTYGNHLRFQCYFNLHIRCIASEIQRPKGDWSRRSRPNFALFTPVKLGKGGQDIRVRVSCSAEDPTSDIFLMRGCCVFWEIQHIFPTQIYKLTSVFQKWSSKLPVRQMLGGHTTFVNAPLVCIRCQVHDMLLF